VLPAKLSDAAARLVGSVIEADGMPLDATTKSFLESRFRASFSHVRVHTGRHAGAVALLLGARAFNWGRHIVFGGDQYDVASLSGIRLLAHELTHVVQQEGAPPNITFSVGAVDDPLEREADLVAERIVAPGNLPAITGGAPAALRRVIIISLRRRRQPRSTSSEPVSLPGPPPISEGTKI
jgi:hypothetical protein